MRHRFVLLLVTLLLGSSCLASAQVVSEKARQERLDALGAVIDSPPYNPEASLQSCRDPFFPPESGVSVLSDGDGAAGDNAATQQRVALSVILEEAAARIGAVGLMERANKQYLAGKNGQLFRIGQMFSFNHAGQSYLVCIESADSDGFVLSCEELSQRILFGGLTQKSAAGVEKNRSSDQ